MSLLHLRIRGRLYAGFGALVLFGVALAAFAVWQLSGILRQTDQMIVLSEHDASVLAVTADIQAIRRAILRYDFDHDKTSYEESEQSESHAIKLLDAQVKSARSD